MRLRIITSRPPGYRRGGLVIGGPAAPTIVRREDVSREGLLAIVSDPNLALAFSKTDDGDDFEKIDAEDREEIRKAMEAELLRVDRADTSINGLAASLVVTDEQAGFDQTPYQAASGADGEPDGAAASAGEPEAKVAEDPVVPAAVDPAGTSDASAASEEISDTPPSQTGASEAGEQPEPIVSPATAEQPKPEGEGERSKPEGEAKRSGRAKRNG